MKKTTVLFAFFYRLHRFGNLSTRVAFFQVQLMNKKFYQLRDVAIAYDFFLSSLFYLSIPVMGYLVFSAVIYNSLLCSVWLLSISVFWSLMFKKEKLESSLNSMMPFSIYNMNHGSAKTLTGSVVILHLFVDGEKRRWSAKKKKKANKQVEQSTLWISEEAKRFDVDLTFKHKVLEDVEFKYLGVIPESKNLYQDLNKFREEIEGVLNPIDPAELAGGDADNVCLMVHVPTKIRSYAVSSAVGAGDDACIPEYCVLAANARPSTYAHELLHLFGADDYYYESSSKINDIKAEFITRSIMFSGGVMSIERLVLDDLTAQNVGWV